MRNCLTIQNQIGCWVTMMTNHTTFWTTPHVEESEAARSNQRAKVSKHLFLLYVVRTEDSFIMLYIILDTTFLICLLFRYSFTTTSSCS